MTIDANGKIVKKISEILPEKDAINHEFYIDEKADELFFKLPYFRSIRELLQEYRKENIQYGIDVYTFPNGLNKLKSYFILPGEYEIQQVTITESLEDKNYLLNVCSKTELKALQQFFITSKSSNTIFGTSCECDQERCIETREVEVGLEDQEVGIFTQIKQYATNMVYAEKYKPLNIVTDWVALLKDASSNIELEVLYKSGYLPIFAELLDKDKGVSLLKGKAYNPNNQQDANKLLVLVNYEIDGILNKFVTLIDDYNEKIEEGSISPLTESNVVSNESAKALNLKDSN